METATKIIAVGIGGSLGAIGRHLINLSPLNGMMGKFPLPTFFINVIGSFLIGLLLILFNDRFEVNEHVRLAVIVGFLGAFTTFSTFEVEIYGLFKGNQSIMAIIYLISSVTVGFLGLLIGVWLGRRL